MFGGVPRARMFWRVHNYDLKKKTYSGLAFGRNDNYNLKIKKIQWFGRCIITSGKKWLIHLAVSGNGWGGSTSSDVSAVHNYDLKKKTYSRLAIGRNDNYDLNKKRYRRLAGS
jgi:hypothetical protein